MGKHRFNIFAELPLRVVNRLFYDPARRRRYLQAEREFDSNCDRMAWLLATAYIDALSVAVDNPTDSSLGKLLPVQKTVARFMALFARQDELLATMRKNLSPRTEIYCRMSIMRYDCLAKIVELLPVENLFAPQPAEGNGTH